MQDFTNLFVWQRARKLTLAIYRVRRNFPTSEQFGITAQMRRASVSICSNIAEGCGRKGDPEFRRFLHFAMGSACELECELILSGDLSFLPPVKQKELSIHVSEVKRLLSGLIAIVAKGNYSTTCKLKAES
jgi:four helix bundle protein